MNSQTTIKLADELSDDLAYEIADDIASNLSNVTAFKPQPERPKAERLADLHRSQLHVSLQRVADAKRNLKIEIATLAASRKAAVKRHQEAMQAITDREMSAREATALAIFEDERLVKYNKAAIDALAE